MFSVECLVHVVGIHAFTNKEVKMQRGTPLSLKFTLSKHTLLANALSKFSFWTLNSFSPLSTLKKTQLFIRNKHTLPTAT